MEYKFGWEEILELLRYYRKGGIETNDGGEYQGRPFWYWAGAGEAMGIVALHLYPKQYNEYIFTEVLPLPKSEDEDAGRDR